MKKTKIITMSLLLATLAVGCTKDDATIVTNNEPATVQGKSPSACLSMMLTTTAARSRSILPELITSQPTGLKTNGSCLTERTIKLVCFLSKELTT